MYDADWCRDHALSLLDFHAQSLNPAGGFFKLATDGTPLPDDTRELHETTRMVHAYARGAALGHPAAARMVDHGMDFLLSRHRDPVYGGFWWSVGDDGPRDRRKQAYGHAFVLLAAASARQVGHPRADVLAALAREGLARFWEEGPGAVCDTFAEDWTGPLAYRGGNANMHLTEALLAAHAAWSDPADLVRAGRIAGLMIDRHARAEGWVVPEHFTPDWQVDPDFDGDAMFRPSGTTPGHAIEWARLLLEMKDAGGDDRGWTLPAARALYDRAMGEAWLPDGGLAYTMGWDGRVSRPWRFWWPCAEAIATAAILARHTGEDAYRAQGRKIWQHVDRHHIDHANGGWFPEIDPGGRPIHTVFAGKPDIYHALTAALSGL